MIVENNQHSALGLTWELISEKLLLFPAILIGAVSARIGIWGVIIAEMLFHHACCIGLLDTPVVAPFE